MHLPNYFRSTILLFAVLFTGSLRAQLSEEDKTAAIKSIANQIATNYVFQDKGGQIASYIQMANFKGEFKKANTWTDFDSLVTMKLRSFSNDGHLYVRYNPDVVKQLNEPSSGKEETEHMRYAEKRATDDNYGFKESKVLDGNIGYLKISEISINKNSLPKLYEAMRKVENTDALIIDLRDNGGGGSEIGAVMETYFLGEGKPTLEFLSRKGTVRVDSTVNWLQEKKYTRPVYIIVNHNTASAAEAFAFVLQQNNRAKIVGENSAGAANMNEYYPVNDENFVSVSVASPNLYGKNLSWEQTGIRPDFKIKSGKPVDFIINKISSEKK